MFRPVIPNLERRLRLLSAANPEAGAPILIGSPLLLTAGIADVAIVPGPLAGFAAEPRLAANQPEFTTGGGDGGAFTVDVHGAGFVLAAIAHDGATFLMNYGDGAGNAITPAVADVGQVFDLEVDANGVPAVNSTTAGAGTTVRVVNLVTTDEDQNIPESARHYVEVVAITPQLNG